ncbi:hypothetical protein JTE90_005890 [Oedothorax gibbosus]|uniref:RRM domain-containing protein n=1 Tax=Oedothorax gibbosus TaxID=931172 RepID=A0AAV6TQH2_9ARAC|nr:hypothetical protein JTE90_005890 [Oedothorax gibbosus]
MESSNSSSEFPNGTPNNQITDSNSKKTWVPKSRPVPSDRKHGKKREHSPEKEWGKGKSPTRKNPDNSREDEGKDKPKEELQFQPTQQPPISIHAASTSTYPANGYATSDYYAVDPNQNNYMMPQYNMYNTMNQWGASVSSSMPPMDMTSTSTGHQDVPQLHPCCPSPGAPVPTRRNRPNGCKTVFVGGLPEKITEEIIKEAFSDCGEISTVRMSKKNFCHIRFASEHMVDQAMFFSGYRLKIENKDEPAYSSRIHVDFAIARDDQYEYECMMRTLSREMRHEKEGLRPPSPPPIVNYSECEAATLGESLRNEDTFKQALEVLITWLDRGECNKRNAGTFYSMIQSTYSHVRRLVAEKTKIEDELTAVKQKLHQQSTANAQHFMDIESVFNHASAQKVWDHFTKAQRKHIDQWKRQTTDIKLQNLEDLLEERIEDEMEMSDSEDQKPPEESTEKKLELNEELAKVQEDKQKLQEEVEMLRNQLQATNNEMVSSKDENEKKITALSDTYQLMQQNYLETKKKLEETVKEKMALVSREIVSLDKQQGGGNCVSASGAVTESEARLVSLIATFLNVHPLGASIDYICSYLVKMDRNINTRDVENLMMKFNTVFKEESTGIGATLEKKWIFYGYKFYTSPSSESIF